MCKKKTIETSLDDVDGVSFEVHPIESDGPTLEDATSTKLRSSLKRLPTS